MTCEGRLHDNAVLQLSLASTQTLFKIAIGAATDSRHARGRNSGVASPVKETGGWTGKNKVGQNVTLTSPSERFCSWKTYIIKAKTQSDIAPNLGTKKALNSLRIKGLQMVPERGTWSLLKNAIYAEVRPIDTTACTDYFKHKCQKMAKAFAIPTA